MNKLYNAIRFAYQHTITNDSTLRNFFSCALWHYRNGLPVGYIMFGYDYKLWQTLGDDTFKSQAEILSLNTSVILMNTEVFITKYPM